MITMDVFKSDAFSATSMTAAIDKVGYKPGFLSSMPGLIVPKPVRTESVWIEERENGPALIQTDNRGAPPKRRGRGPAKVRGFKTVRIAETSTIHASELQGMRAFGSETELQTVQQEVAQRQALLKNDVGLTKENMYLGMIQGIVYDADGSVLFDWGTELNQEIPAEVDFDLDAANPASGIIRKRSTAVVRSVTKGLKGVGGTGISVVGLCGDAFDDLTAHKETRETYLNQQAASELRDGNAYGEFRYAGIRYVNYRGTDDGSTVAVGTDKCKFFPVGAGIFQMAYAPAERFEFVNTLGLPEYSWIVPDKDRDMFVDVEAYSYPLPVCTMPGALASARRT